MSNSRSTARRLAIVTSHPVQYYAPWFKFLAENLPGSIRVFYLWDFGVIPQRDRDFQFEFAWDIDLLDGYEFTFLKNKARKAGSHHFFGLRNPTLISRLTAWRPDAILLFGYRSWSYLRLILSRRLGRVPILFRGDSHLLAERSTLARRIFKRHLLALIFRRFKACLWVGRANRLYFHSIKVPENSLFRVPHTVDGRRFRPLFNSEESIRNRQAWNIPDGHCVLLFVGKLETKKRPDDLVAAFISSQLRNVTLLIVGSGHLEPTLKKQADSHPHIRFASFQNQSRMPEIYGCADLLCLPSQGPDETWGLAVQEAMSCGVPVLVSNEVGCHLDLVRSGWNGLVFAAGNRAALTRALQTAFENPERLRTWGKNGQKLIQDFTHFEATKGLQRALDFVHAGEAP